MLDTTDDVASSAASIITSRPVFDLRNSHTAAYEYIACDHESFLPNKNILLVANLPYILEMGQSLSLPEILFSVPADVFVEINLSDKIAWMLRSLLLQGTVVSILLSATDDIATARSIGSGMQNWRRIGCSVGMDGFGYAAVPALWPLVQNVDVIRFDPRLIGMVHANVISALPAQKLVQLMAAMNISRIIMDACLSRDDALMFQEAGASYGQGPPFGEFSLTQPY